MIKNKITKKQSKIAYIQNITQKQQDIFNDNRLIKVSSFDQGSVDGFIIHGTCSANFSTPLPNQQPSPQLTDLMNFYLEAKQSNNQNDLDAARTLLNQRYIHKEYLDWSKPWNYDIGNERGIFYQNQ